MKLVSATLQAILAISFLLVLSNLVGFFISRPEYGIIALVTTSVGILILSIYYED